MKSITTGRGFFPPTAAAAPHDWLQNMGGSIGFSTPIATGAAVACPDRKVICMVGDGSAMYTLQSLWTQAREGLNVLTIVFANRIYQILRGEFDGVGAGEPGQRALDMLKIDRPTLDFVSLARGMGVPGRAVSNVDEFNKALAEGVAEKGPRLIEVQMEQLDEVLTGNVGARPDAHCQISVVTRLLDQRANAELRELRAAVSCGRGNDGLISPFHQDVGHRLGQDPAAGDRQQMIMALGSGILDQGILVKSFAVPENGSGHLYRGIRCEDAMTSVGKRAVCSIVSSNLPMTLVVQSDPRRVWIRGQRDR